MDCSLGVGSEDQVRSVYVRRWYLLVGENHLGVMRECIGMVVISQGVIRQKESFVSIEESML